jgi:hypothetical protein
MGGGGVDAGSHDQMPLLPVIAISCLEDKFTVKKAF